MSNCNFKYSARKFSPKEVIAMRRQYADGASASSLAREHGAGYEVIRRLLTGKTYADIPCEVGMRAPGSSTELAPVPPLVHDIRALRQMVKAMSEQIATLQ